jgi:hypothetical protein
VKNLKSLPAKPHYALITGASSGIGKSLAEKFAREKINLVLVARNRARLEELALEIKKNYGVSALAIAKDLSQPSAPREIAAELEKNFIEADILVNNAGFNVYGEFAGTDFADELAMIQVNIIALAGLTKLLMPGMVKNKFGKILNIGSTGSFAPGVYNSVYCATKAFVLSFSEALAEELKGSGVSVTALCPGATETEFAQRAGMEKVKIFRGKTMSAEKVAEIGFASLIKGERTIVPGILNKLLVFSLRFSPRVLTAKVSKNLMSKV